AAQNGARDAASGEKAASAAPERTRPAARDDKGILRMLPPDSVCERTIATADGPLAYTATAGTLALMDQNGEQSAALFYTAYVAKGGNDTRPVTFAFNGGPGAASAYLHLGLAGPRIVRFGADGRDGAKT